MYDHHAPIVGAVNVDLQHVHPDLDGALESRQGVFGGETVACSSPVSYADRMDQSKTQAPNLLRRA